MFEAQTFDAILERMLNNISDDIDKREGSVAYDMLAPKAAELAQSYLALDTLLRVGFVTTTYGEFLDKKASEAGITRIPATYAKGQVTFDITDPLINIPAGTVVYTDNGIKFTTDVPSVTGQTVNITAVNPGLEGNVPVNSIINVEMDEVTCNNNDIITGGEDTESDESVLNRYYLKVKSPAISGNAKQYLLWALEVDGIGGARVIPIWNGNGTVKVIVIGEDKRAVLPAKITEVFNYIETVRPIGASVTVQTATEKMVTVSVDVTITSQYTIGQVKDAITSKLSEHFKDVAFVDNDIKYSKIGTLILDVPGVLDYTNLLLNGGTSNVPTLTNEVAVLGTVTVT